MIPALINHNCNKGNKHPNLHHSFNHLPNIILLMHQILAQEGNHYINPTSHQLMVFTLEYISQNLKCNLVRRVVSVFNHKCINNKSLFTQPLSFLNQMSTLLNINLQCQCQHLKQLIAILVKWTLLTMFKVTFLMPLSLIWINSPTILKIMVVHKFQVLCILVLQVNILCLCLLVWISHNQRVLRITITRRLKILSFIDQSLLGNFHLIVWNLMIISKSIRINISHLN